MTEQPTTPEPARPLPRLGKGIRWGAIVAEIDRDQRARTRDTEPAVELTVQAETVTSGGEIERPAYATGGLVVSSGSGASDVIPLPVSRCLYEQPRAVPPPAAELRAMADDLNAHGGLDEIFVAGLLQHAAELSSGRPIQFDTEFDGDPAVSNRVQTHVVPFGEPFRPLDNVLDTVQHPPEHQHIWTATSPMRCVECRRYLRPWWRRALDRVQRWTR